MKYKVEFTLYALEDIESMDKSIASRIIRKIDGLAQNFELIIPQPLKGKFQGMYKLTVGDWRV